MTSIRRWLLGWLIFGLAATSLVAGYGIFHAARREASELFDYELRAVTLSLLASIAVADAAERHSHDVNGIADDRIAIDIRDKQVAQPFSIREDLALRPAWRTLWPLALVVPVIIALVLFSWPADLRRSVDCRGRYRRGRSTRLSRCRLVHGYRWRSLHWLIFEHLCAMPRRRRAIYPQFRSWNAAFCTSFSVQAPVVDLVKPPGTDQPIRPPNDYWY